MYFNFHRSTDVLLLKVLESFDSQVAFKKKTTKEF